MGDSTGFTFQFLVQKLTKSEAERASAGRFSALYFVNASELRDFQYNPYRKKPTSVTIKLQQQSITHIVKYTSTTHKAVMRKKLSKTLG